MAVGAHDHGHVGSRAGAATGARGPVRGASVVARDVVPFVLGAVMPVTMVGWLLLH
jgi:hypothetical protein